METELTKQLLETKDDTDPVLRPAVVLSVVAGILDAIVAFGLDLPIKTTSGILLASVIGIPILHAAWARKRSWSPAGVVKLLEEIGMVVDRDIYPKKNLSDELDSLLERKNAVIVTKEQLAKYGLTKFL